MERDGAVLMVKREQHERDKRRGRYRQPAPASDTGDHNIILSGGERQPAAATDPAAPLSAAARP